jgi:hypothetical protein
MRRARMPELRPDIREVYEMVTEQRPSDPGALERQHTRQVRTMRNRRIGAFAVTAAMAAVVVVLILANRSVEDERTAGNDRPSLSSAGTPAEEVATDFVRAVDAFDTDRAMTYLADDADVTDLVTSLGDEGLSGTRDELRLFLSMLEAMRFDRSIGFCEETGSTGSATDVRCQLSFYLLGSDEFGRGAFRGSYIDTTVREGQIVRASAHWDTEELSSRAWEPFAHWVSNAYPEDAATMYEDETYGAAHLSEQSIRLWEQKVSEFVMTFATNPGPPFVGRITRTVDGVPFSVRVPAADWYQFGSVSINKSIRGPQGAEAIIFWATLGDGSNVEPCSSVLGSSVGTAADLAAVVAAAPGTELAAGPSEVSVDGYPAKQVVLTVREGAGCDPGYFFSWHDMHGGPLWPGTPIGATIKLWIIDVDGTLLFIEAETTPDADADLQQEIEQIVGSIRFR